MGIQCCGAAATGVYATNAWPQVEYVVKNSESKFFFVENEEQLDKWLHFKDNTPDLIKVIVWDTEGLRQFKDPMFMTFDELLDLLRTQFAVLISVRSGKRLRILSSCFSEGCCACAFDRCDIDSRARITKIRMGCCLFMVYYSFDRIFPTYCRSSST